MKTTTITLKNEHGEYSVTVPGVELDMERVVEGLVKPLLLAAGYHYETLEEFFK